MIPATVRGETGNWCNFKLLEKKHIIIKGRTLMSNPYFEFREIPKGTVAIYGLGLGVAIKAEACVVNYST